jgi:hypothetical protein
MKVMAFVEFAAPFRPRPRVERVGALWRFIWLWFSVGVIRAGFNDMLRELRQDGQK